jgi:hypothetical protein
VIADGETDWRRVVADAARPGAWRMQPIWYQKHMTHHLLPGMDAAGSMRAANMLLIRDPREVVASYLKSRAESRRTTSACRSRSSCTTNCPRHGEAPPIIDAGDFLRAPEAHLRALCGWLGIDFTSACCAGPKGPRASDGVWAPHWYARSGNRPVSRRRSRAASS